MDAPGRAGGSDQAGPGQACQFENNNVFDSLVRLSDNVLIAVIWIQMISSQRFINLDTQTTMSSVPRLSYPILAPSRQLTDARGNGKGNSGFKSVSVYHLRPKKYIGDQMNHRSSETS